MKREEIIREIEKGTFDWKKESYLVARYCPEKLDTEKFNWEKHSWAVALFCPEYLDANKFNWKEYSHYVAQFCPDNIIPEKYNWKKYSWAVAKYCPNKIDPERFNWVEYGFDVIQYCPDKLHLKPANKKIVLYHATTEKLAKAYRKTGYIKRPVRGFTTLQAAMAWAIKSNRKVIYEIVCDNIYKLPDHHNIFGDAWWNDGDVKEFRCVFSANSDA